MKTPPLLIVGTGAMGTLFAARLSAAGVPVAVLGTWRQGLQALRHKGAVLEGAGAFPVQIAHSGDIQQARFALVLVKSWQTERAARQVSACLSPQGLALSLQNGLGNEAVLGRFLGASRVARGVTTLGATLLGPGRVLPAGDGPVMLEVNPRLAGLQELLQQAGFEVRTTGDVRSLVWSKLVVSSAINPLSAILRLKNGELLERPFARQLLGALADETARVAGMLGITLQFRDPVEATEDVARRTAENISSMLQDVLRGSPTEVDALNGAVLQLAQAGNLELPVNRLILSLVKALPVRGKIGTMSMKMEAQP